MNVDFSFWQGRAKPLQADQRINVNKGQQSIPEQKHGQIPPATYMGWGSNQQHRT